MLDKLHIFISLIAGIIYTTYAILHNFEFFFWIKNVITVLIIFYILGIITRKYLTTILEPPNVSEVSVEEVEETDEEETEQIEEKDEKKQGSKGAPKRRFDFSRDGDE